MAGTATVSSTWPDGVSSETNVHFTGTMKMGPQAAPVEWTMKAISAYRGPACGGVKPPQVQ
jgi:hypothetical protein